MRGVGMACPFQLQDVRNVLRTQTDERKKRSATVAALDDSERASESAPADASDNDDNGDAENERRTAAQTQSARKRPFHATAPDVLSRSLVPLHEPLTLARLEMLLDSGYCYALSHHYVRP